MVPLWITVAHSIASLQPHYVPPLATNVAQGSDADDGILQHLLEDHEYLISTPSVATNDASGSGSGSGSGAFNGIIAPASASRSLTSGYGVALALVGCSLLFCCVYCARRKSGASRSTDAAGLSTPNPKSMAEHIGCIEILDASMGSELHVEVDRSALQTNAKSNGEKIVGLTLEGGGVKGIAYGGAVKVLEEKGVLDEITMFAGASAGSSGAAFLAMRFTAAELAEATVNTPWKDFMDGSANPIFNFNRLFAHFGYYKGDALENHLNKLFEEKTNIKDITFKQVHETFGTWLKIPITNVSQRSITWLDHTSHPELKVAHACRMSSTLPLFYEAQQFEGDWVIDGGLLNNLPARAFKEELNPGEVCMALNLMSDNERDGFKDAADIRKPDCTCVSCGCCAFCPCVHSDLHKFSGLIFETLFANAQKNDNDDLPDWCHLINIPTGTISASKFNLSNAERDQLSQSGAAALGEYFGNGVTTRQRHGGRAIERAGARSTSPKALDFVELLEMRDSPAGPPRAPVPRARGQQRGDDQLL